MKNKIFKISSILYFFVISIAFVIPLDFFVVTKIVDVKSQPSNNTSYIVHLILFFILYLIFYFSFSNKYKILIFCLIYSVVIEILQLFTSRGFQFMDIVFNLTGIVISFIFIRFVVGRSVAM